MRYNKLLKFIIVIIVITAITITSLKFCESILIENLMNIGNNTMAEVLSQQKSHFQSKIDSKMSNLANMSAIISDSTINKDTIHKTLNDIAVNNHFESIIITNIKGDGITSTGQKVFLGKQQFFFRFYKR